MNKFLKNKKLITNIFIYGVIVVVIVMFLYNKNMKLSGPAYFFKTKDINRKDVNLNDYKNKVILLDFWATWCPPCRTMIPILRDLQEEFKDNLKIVGIHTINDYMGDSYTKKFIKNYKLNYDVWLSTREIEQRYKVDSYPTMVIIDKKGEIKFYTSGAHSKRKLKKIIEELLSE